MSERIREIIETLKFSKMIQCIFRSSCCLVKKVKDGRDLIPLYNCNQASKLIWNNVLILIPTPLIFYLDHLLLSPWKVITQKTPRFHIQNTKNRLNQHLMSDIRMWWCRDNKVIELQTVIISIDMRFSNWRW